MHPTSIYKNQELPSWIKKANPNRTSDPKSNTLILQNQFTVVKTIAVPISATMTLDHNHLSASSYRDTTSLFASSIDYECNKARVGAGAGTRYALRGR